MTDDLLEGGNWWKTSDSPGSRSCFDPIGKFSYFEWRYVRYPWWLPPRDRCAWSPEIARKRTREMERDRQVHQMIDAAETLRLARVLYLAQRRQALTAIVGGLLVGILVVVVAGI